MLLNSWELPGDEASSEGVGGAEIVKSVCVGGGRVGVGGLGYMCMLAVFSQVSEITIGGGGRDLMLLDWESSQMQLCICVGHSRFQKFRSKGYRYVCGLIIMQGHV